MRISQIEVLLRSKAKRSLVLLIGDLCPFEKQLLYGIESCYVTSDSFNREVRRNDSVNACSHLQKVNLIEDDAKGQKSVASRFKLFDASLNP